MRWNKETLLHGKDVKEFWKSLGEISPAGITDKIDPERLKRFVEQSCPSFSKKGIGNEVALHVSDFVPPLGINFPGILGYVLPRMLDSSNRSDVGAEAVAMVPVLFATYGSFFAPIYGSVSVEDPRVVDDFFDQLDQLLSGVLPCNLPTLGIGEPLIEIESYPLMLHGGQTKARCLCCSIGPITLRFCYARIGKGLYFTIRPDLLEEIQAALLGDKAQLAAEDSSPAMEGR